VNALLFIASGVLEIAGIAIVTWDLWSTRRRVREFLSEGSQEGTSWAQLQQLGEFISRVYSGFQLRFLGVACLIIGILLATWGNLSIRW
jgi:hypothetical protein